MKHHDARMQELRQFLTLDCDVEIDSTEDVVSRLYEAAEGDSTSSLSKSSSSESSASQKKKAKKKTKKSKKGKSMEKDKKRKKTRAKKNSKAKQAGTQYDPCPI